MDTNPAPRPRTPPLPSALGSVHCFLAIADILPPALPFVVSIQDGAGLRRRWRRGSWSERTANRPTPRCESAGTPSCSSSPLCVLVLHLVLLFRVLFSRVLLLVLPATAETNTQAEGSSSSRGYPKTRGRLQAHTSHSSPLRPGRRLPLLSDGLSTHLDFLSSLSLPFSWWSSLAATATSAPPCAVIQAGRVAPRPRPAPGAMGATGRRELEWRRAGLPSDPCVRVRVGLGPWVLSHGFLSVGFLEPP